MSRKVMISELSSAGLKVMEGRMSRKVMRKGETMTFPCNYCQRKFPSCQALGGHQKIHKKERSFIKLNGGGRHHGGSLLIHGSTADHITRTASLYKAVASHPLGIQLLVLSITLDLLVNEMHNPGLAGFEFSYCVQSDYVDKLVENEICIMGIVKCFEDDLAHEERFDSLCALQKRHKIRWYCFIYSKFSWLLSYTRS